MTKFTTHQWAATSITCIAVGLFGSTLTDKEPPYGLYIGVVLVVVAAAVALFVRFNTVIPPPEAEYEEEEEPIERESRYYLTARELINILEKTPDDTVVVDGEGNPITNVLSAVYDEDFETAVWLVGFPVNRNMYKLAQKAPSALPPSSPPVPEPVPDAPSQDK
jgi:hypothetical protein